MYFIILIFENNFPIFYKYLPEVSNSQGREQTHSELENVVDSLGQMNYRNFMLMRGLGRCLKLKKNFSCRWGDKQP